MKDDYDGAEPSGNSIAALALLRLSRLTHVDEFRVSAERALAAFAERLVASGAAVPQMLVALMYSASAPHQVVVAGENAEPPSPQRSGGSCPKPRASRFGTGHCPA